MRYFNVANATFVDWNGVSWNLKDVREVPMSQQVGQKVAKYQQASQLVPLKTIPTQGASTFLDEIASRPDVYGEGNESDCYLIFDMNADAIASASFDLASIKSLVIPRKATEG